MRISDSRINSIKVPLTTSLIVDNNLTDESINYKNIFYYSKSNKFTDSLYSPFPFPLLSSIFIFLYTTIILPPATLNLIFLDNANFQ
jgi:hypothetical protein